MKFLRWSTFAAMVVACAGASAWESRLYPADSGVQAVRHEGRDWKPLDYSYVGYRLGAVSPASDIPCASVTLTGKGDIGAELQDAVNRVGPAGGTVRIPAGRFILGRSIEVPFSNVSIVGAGSARTRLTVPASYRPRSESGEGVFTFGKALGGWHKAWVDRGKVLADVTRRVREGDNTVEVSDSSAIRVGAWIVVAQYAWKSFSLRASGGAWPWVSGFPGGRAAGLKPSFAYLRQVTGRSGATLRLDAPLPWTLDPADNPVKVSDAGQAGVAMRTNLGVSGLSIEFEDNHNATGGRPAGIGVYFEGVRDGWIHDVRVQNFPRYGLHLDHAARISVLDSTVLKAQDYGVGGYGYGVSVEASQNILVRRVRVEDTRRGFVIRNARSSSLVFTQNESIASRLGDDSHYGMSQGVLWDAHRLSRGADLQGLYRGALSGGAHETVGSAVYWNPQSDGSGALRLNPAADGWAAVVGSTGIQVFDVGADPGTHERIKASAELQLGSVREAPGPGSRDRNTLYEGVDRGGLEPASLYEAQRHRRLGSAPAAPATCQGLSPADASAVRAPDRGTAR